MDNDTIIGAAKQISGRVERAAGSVADDGNAEIRGAAQKTFGEAKDKVRGLIGGNSASALLAAGAAGLIVGLFIRR
jgi:uncharacterized protein YjbJ (UPF0337 family)